MKGQQFLPASDCSNLTLNSIVEAVLSYVNCGSVPASEGIEYASQDEILQSALDEKSSLLKPLIWSSDLSFSSNFVQSRIGTGIKGVGGQGLLDSLGSVWDEFISGHQLVPVSIFVAGNPQCGKTAVAKSIEETFKCLYVDIPSAVTFALRKPTQENSVGSALKSEIMSIVEAKAAEGKKAPKKGEEPEEVVIDPTTVEVDDALLEALSSETKRRCLAYMITTDKKAKRRGYVMDIWQTGLVSSYEQLQEAVTAIKAPAEAPAEAEALGEGQGAAKDETQVATEETVNEVSDVPGAADKPTSPPFIAFPEVILELQCSDEVLMARLHEKEGIVDGDMKKASKEAQAAVKAFEPILAGYTAQLEAIPIPEPVPSATDEAPASSAEGEGEGCAESKKETKERSQSPWSLSSP